MRINIYSVNFLKCIFCKYLEISGYLVCIKRNNKTCEYFVIYCTLQQIIVHYILYFFINLLIRQRYSRVSKTRKSSFLIQFGANKVDDGEEREKDGHQWPEEHLQAVNRCPICTCKYSFTQTAVVLNYNG